MVTFLIRPSGRLLRRAIQKDTARHREVDLTVSGGIGGRGLIPGRDEDTFGLGFAYTDFDATALLAAVGFEDDGYGFEGFYNFDLGPGLSLTANVQVIDSVLSGTDTATILGARLNIRF